jgi:predicted aminopeptidase
VALSSLAAVGLLAVAVACATSGCGTVGYYARQAQGHLAIVAAAKPVDAWLADPATEPRLRERLVLSQRIRDFAVTDLAEPDNASYRRYAALGRGAAVWNVVAAPELSLVPRTWCFAVVGCVAYRGHYDRARADAEAAELRAAGWDASVYPVAAYSTLGKLPFDVFADPLLDTFVFQPEADLARLVFHELAHQIAFAPGDTEFNESYATAVETLGGRRWLAAHASDATRAADARARARREDFRALVASVRAELAALYAGPLDADAKRAGKAAAFARLRAEHARLKAERWDGDRSYDAWIARADNAAFAIQASYTALVPAFERLFEREGADFRRFHAEVARIAALHDRAARRAALPPATP